MRLRYDGDAGDAEGIHAHRLRLVAWRQRRASAREAHNAAAYRAEQHGTNRRPKLTRQLFLSLLFPFLLFVVVVVGWWVGGVLRALKAACEWDVCDECDAWDI